jgi:hypothetical protein
MTESIIILSVGVVLFAFGIAAKRGQARTRVLFMGVTNPLVAPVDSVYALFPFGFGSVMMGIGFALSSPILAGIGLAGGVVAGFVMMIWKPRWLKPDWLLWLEQHYDRSTIEYMFTQVRRNKSQFQKVRTCTREQFEVWAQEMAEECKR